MIGLVNRDDLTKMIESSALTSMDEQDFRRKCDAALESLKRRLLELGDELGFEVEGQGDKLELLFEEPEEARFVISPNSAVRQIWISALTTSFKLDWSDQSPIVRAGQNRRGLAATDGPHPHATTRQPRHRLARRRPRRKHRQGAPQAAHHALAAQHHHGVE